MCEVLHSHHADAQEHRSQHSADNCAHARRLTCQLLLALANMVDREAGREAFRFYAGYQIVLTILQHARYTGGHEDAASNNTAPHDTANTAMLIARALSLLAVSTHDSPENHIHLWQNVGIDTMHSVLQNANILGSSEAQVVLEALLGMACGRAMCLLNIADPRNTPMGKKQENDGIKAMSWKAEALVLMLGLCEEMAAENAARMLFVVACIASARPDNAVQLAVNGAVKTLLLLLVHGPVDTVLRERIVEILATIGAVHLDPTDARRLLKLCWDTRRPWRALLLPVLQQISQTHTHAQTRTQSTGGVSSSYIRFSMEVHGYASAEMHIEKEIAWPPTAGYSVGFWVCVDNFGVGPVHLMHLYAHAKILAKGTHNTSILLNKYDGEGHLSMLIGDTDEVCFSTFAFRPHTWYHVVLVHVQNKLHKSEAFLYVNGQLRQQGNFSTLSPPAPLSFSLARAHVRTRSLFLSFLPKHTHRQAQNGQNNISNGSALVSADN